MSKSSSAIQRQKAFHIPFHPLDINGTRAIPYTKTGITLSGVISSLRPSKITCETASYGCLETDGISGQLIEVRASQNTGAVVSEDLQKHDYLRWAFQKQKKSKKKCKMVLNGSGIHIERSSFSVLSVEETSSSHPHEPRVMSAPQTDISNTETPISNSKLPPP